MDILAFIAFAVLALLTYNKAKAKNANKLCASGLFHIWLVRYVRIPYSSFDKETMAKAFITQAAIASEVINIFLNANDADEAYRYEQGCDELKKISPDEAVSLVNGWIKKLIPIIVDAAGMPFIHTISAKDMAGLMFIMACRVNPHEALKDYLHISRRSSKTIAEENDSLGDHPIIDERHRFLKLFLMQQEATLRGIGGKLLLQTEKEKLLHLHFVIGAIDELGKTIQDKALSAAWWISVPMTYAITHWGVDDAIERLESYGQSGDADLDNAGKRGQHAMRVCILAAMGEISEQNYKSACLELLKIVHGERNVS